MEEYAILVKKVNDNYIIIGHGEYEKLYRVYRNLDENHSILEINKEELNEIIHNSVELQLKIKELIQKKNDIDNIN